MKTCPICKTKYPEDANFCPLETCATTDARNGSRPCLMRQSRASPRSNASGRNTGEVWRARDGQTGAEVALKLVNQEVLGSPASQSRAEREFKQLMRVSSPKVALSSIVASYLTSAFSSPWSFPWRITGQLVANWSARPRHGQGADRADRPGASRGAKGRSGPSRRLTQECTGCSAGDVKIINFPLARPVTDRVAGDPPTFRPTGSRQAG